MTANILGKVFLVGAGPGDPELLTLKGKRCLEQADVIFFDDLVNRELLDHAVDAELIYVGKRASNHGTDQSEINNLVIGRARSGQNVVRLKGGDPFVFGRGGEEAQALQQAGIAYEIVPGVTSAVAAPAYAGIPLTHRVYGSSVAIVTGHRAEGGEGQVKWGELARGVDTLVILMGLHNLRKIMNRLLQTGCESDRPVAVIQSATRLSQKTLVGTVATIAGLAEQQDFRSPAVIVVGAVVRLRDELKWFHNEFGHDHPISRNFYQHV
jgi:uroporphyrin-III C-methyltransferase